MPARKIQPIKARVMLMGADSTLERNMVAASLPENCEVILAADPDQALEATQTGQVDVLVVDSDIDYRELPDLAMDLGSAERHCRTLVLVESLERLTLASETCADAALMKPIDPKQLRQVVHNLLADARTSAPAERRRPERPAFSEVASFQSRGNLGAGWRPGAGDPQSCQSIGNGFDYPFDSW